VTYNVTELQLLLQWKLGDGYHQHNKKKSLKLQAVWLEHQGNLNFPDIALPQEMQEPTVLSIERPNLDVSASVISKTASIAWLDILLHSFSSFKSN
jgi:hypothetical protein